MNEKKVWLVSSGDYSDYSISAVFSTEQKASNFVNAMKPDEYRIEEYLLDSPDEEFILRIKNGLEHWTVTMEPNSGDNVETYSCKPSGDYPAESRIDHRRRFHCSFMAYSKKEAIKIANEKRIQWLAEHPKVAE